MFTVNYSCHYRARLMAMQHHAMRKRALQTRCHWCRRDETRATRPWTNGHAFWNPERSSAEDQCAGVHESGGGRKTGRLGSSVGFVVGADIGVLADHLPVYCVPSWHCQSLARLARHLSEIETHSISMMHNS